MSYLLQIYPLYINYTKSLFGLVPNTSLLKKWRGFYSHLYQKEAYVVVKFYPWYKHFHFPLCQYH